MGFNRPEWFLADIGAIAAQGVPAGIYTTCTAEQCQYLADHCNAAVAVVEDASYLEKFEAVWDQLPQLETIVLMEGTSDHDRVLSWEEFLESAAKVSEDRLQERIAAQRPDDLCTLIYTSGTTGAPKGVMLSHHNIIWIGEQVQKTFGIGHNESVVCYLPLSHIAEQIVSLHGPMAGGACSWFAESLEKLGANLREVRPHFFFGVPRVWEKIQAGIEAAGAQNPPLKKKIAAWARRQGLAGGYADQRGENKPALYGLADKLVFSKVRAKLGLDRARLCLTSAAPISRHTLEFFLSLGIPILEVYGMSECTGPTTFSEPHRYRTGKAGYAIPGTELTIASDGEVWMRGPHVFLGYFRNPQTTEETLDDEGWLHSGDIGELDEEGFLRITDRKKELIITSGGKNVAPQLVEAQLKTITGVALAAVIGDRRNYLSAILTLDPDTVHQQAAILGSPAEDAEAAAKCPIFREFLEAEVERVNKQLASFEGIKRFIVLPEPFSIEGGELTPTMKLKRRVVNEKYARQIEELYAARD
jgi:long-subunit acyl-CoA synthetase (AMP-forming)